MEKKDQSTNYSLKEVCEDASAREELTAEYHNFFHGMTIDGARAYLRSRGQCIGGKNTKEAITNECVKVRMSEIMSGEVGTKFEELLLDNHHDKRAKYPLS